MNSQAYWQGYAAACLERGINPQGLQKQAVMIGGYDVPESALGALAGGGLGAGIGYGLGGGQGALIGGLGGAGIGGAAGKAYSSHMLGLQDASANRQMEMGMAAGGGDSDPYAGTDDVLESGLPSFTENIPDERYMQMLDSAGGDVNQLPPHMQQLIRQKGLGERLALDRAQAAQAAAAAAGQDDELNRARLKSLIEFDMSETDPGIASKQRAVGRDWAREVEAGGGAVQPGLAPYNQIIRRSAGGGRTR